MTQQQRAERDKVAQRNFDYYIWHNRHLPDWDLLAKLYNIGFAKSEAAKQLQIIKNATTKALK